MSKINKLRIRLIIHLFPILNSTDIYCLLFPRSDWFSWTTEYPVSIALSLLSCRNSYPESLVFCIDFLHNLSFHVVSGAAYSPSSCSSLSQLELFFLLVGQRPVAELLLKWHWLAETVGVREMVTHSLMCKDYLTSHSWPGKSEVTPVFWLQIRKLGTVLIITVIYHST